MLAESVYNGVLDNGNFREFLHGAGGEFSTFKTGIPGGPAPGRDWTGRILGFWPFAAGNSPARAGWASN